MAIIFAVVRPFGADDMDYKLMISAMWLLVSAAHFVLIFSTLKWLVYFVMFRVGVAAYVLATVLIYTITACLCVILAMSALPIEIHLRYFEMVLVFLLVIAFIAGVSVTSYLVMRHPILVGSTGEERLLALLPAELRGEILCLSADDHYVHVVTEKGRDLVRIKFQRAVELMDEAGGCLIHRSHWVSVKAVVSIESRSNGALFAHLKNGDKLPVSKGRAREFKTLVGPLL
ncbi:LytTR family DNA-binding domain-containing protein [Celeribacter persicus]|nr:LytTR family DNA-binding domain-containing protein [Celeribacter persicus]